MSYSKTTEPQVDVNAVSRISEGTSVNGEFVARSDIRIDGNVTGKLFSEGRIVVGENAVIDGTVACNDLDLWGRIDGEVYVRNVLSVKGSANLGANIHVRRLQVEMGALFNGNCKMISEEEFDAVAGKIVSKPVKVENLA